MKIAQRADYTFKHNVGLGRHGWLRLTPAYSVKLVKEIMHQIPKDAFILDPFSGTATTGVVAAEYGIKAHCLDINPFLVWLGNVKCRNYSPKELQQLAQETKATLKHARSLIRHDNWVPPIHNIERWWNPKTLTFLAALRQALAARFGEPQTADSSSLAWVAFSRLVIETSAAAFNHVSMSFHDNADYFSFEQIESLYLSIFEFVVETASPALKGSSSVFCGDAKDLSPLRKHGYSHVITSPPYPNRISYIRELRPYMYWLKMLHDAKSASDLDWEAIGGTWGSATSKLQHWRAGCCELPESLYSAVDKILATENKNTSLMAIYVWKYFHDIAMHLQAMTPLLREGAEIFYIVGNSSFYGIAVDTPQLLEDLLRSTGFSDISTSIIRKRNSKKELFEFCVCASWQKDSTKKTSPLAMSSLHQQRQLSLFNQKA